MLFSQGFKNEKTEEMKLNKQKKKFNNKINNKNK